MQTNGSKKRLDGEFKKELNLIIFFVINLLKL
jgi:hypothetical protein